MYVYLLNFSNATDVHDDNAAKSPFTAVNFKIIRNIYTSFNITFDISFLL